MGEYNTDSLKPVRVTVVSATGQCPQGFKVGDSWLIEGSAPPNMCASAYHTLFPTLRVFRFGGSHPWDKEKGVTRIGCPDAIRNMIYELRIVEKE